MRIFARIYHRDNNSQIEKIEQPCDDIVSVGYNLINFALKI